MRFCMLTTFYPPYHFGGDATYVYALSQALVRRGHEVTVVHCQDAYQLSGEAPGDVATSTVKVLRLKSAFGMLSPLITQQTGFPGLKQKALKEILDDEFDVVNFHNISLIGGPGVIRLSNAAVNVYTLHEHWLLCPSHIFWKNNEKACDKAECIRCCFKSGIPPQLWRYTPLIQKSLTKVDCFISPSQYTADRHKNGGIKQPIKVLPLFSYLSPENYTDQSEGTVRFITVGRVTASKGMAELCRAFSLWPEFQLTVVGDGDLLESLEADFQQCDNITFLGKLPQDALIEHYRRSTALILPSLAPETFGLTIVEAFACGVPAIVRIAGGNREIVDYSDAGYLYENDEQLKVALNNFREDPTLRQRLGLRARNAYEEMYTEDKHVEGYLSLISELTAAKIEKEQSY